LQVDRQPLRGTERSSAHPELHLSGIRTVPCAGDQRGARGSRAGGLWCRADDHCRRTASAEGRHIASNQPRQPVRGRPWSWITGRPRLTDGLIVAFNLLVGILGLVGAYHRFGSIAAGAIPFVLLEALLLWWRRRYPVSILVLIVCAEVASWALGLGSDPSGIALVFAV